MGVPSITEMLRSHQKRPTFQHPIYLQHKQFSPDITCHLYAITSPRPILPSPSPLSIHQFVYEHPSPTAHHNRTFSAKMCKYHLLRHDCGHSHLWQAGFCTRQYDQLLRINDAREPTDRVPYDCPVECEARVGRNVREKRVRGWYVECRRARKEGWEVRAPGRR